MGTALSVIWQAFSCPITSITSLIMCWIWVKIFMKDWNHMHLSLSLTDCLKKQQYWRILVAPLSHVSLLHLFLDSITLWNCRIVEQQYGSLFFFRYSVLLLLWECLSGFSLIYCCIKLNPVNNATLSHTLTNLPTFGCSGLLLGWMAFYSTDFANHNYARNFVLFGFYNLHPSLAPMVMIIIYHFCLSHNNTFGNLSGLLGGYLLAGKILQVLPGFYWSTCFLLNIALIISASVYFREYSSSVYNWDTNSGNNNINVENDSMTEHIEVIDITHRSLLNNNDSMSNINFQPSIRAPEVGMLSRLNNNSIHSDMVRYEANNFLDVEETKENDSLLIASLPSSSSSIITEGNNSSTDVRGLQYYNSNNNRINRDTDISGTRSSATVLQPIFDSRSHMMQAINRQRYSQSNEDNKVNNEDIYNVVDLEAQ